MSIQLTIHLYSLKFIFINLSLFHKKVVQNIVQCFVLSFKKTEKFYRGILHLYFTHEYICNITALPNMILYGKILRVSLYLLFCFQSYF